MILTRAQRARLRKIVRGRSDEGLFVLEGPKPIREALAGGTVAELWIRADLDPRIADSLRDAAEDADVPIGEGGRVAFDQIAETVTSQGVFALVRDPRRAVNDVAAGAHPWLLWLDGVQDPGNVGALVRVAAAFGAGLLVSRGSAHPMGAKALRASAGLALRTPFAIDDASVLADVCAQAGRAVWLLDAAGTDVFAARVPEGRAALVVGSEGQGARAQARAAATQVVGISMQADVESLNVAVASGIALSVLTRTAGSTS